MEPMETDDIDARTEGDPATQAFARLEGQVALMRRAVEQLAAERADIVIPDYGATLGDMAVRLSEMSVALNAIAGKPAMQFTPETLAERIERAAEAARHNDYGQLAEARQRFDRGVEDMRRLVGQARSADEQRRRLNKAAGGALLAGILLWSFLPGVVARWAPASWFLPERMATRMLGAESAWHAGERLMQAGDAGAWQALTEAADIQRDNRETIAACRRVASQASEAVRCTVKIKARM